MSKRLLAVLFLLAAVALSACGDDDDGGNGGNGDTASDPASVPAGSDVPRRGRQLHLHRNGMGAAKPVEPPASTPDVSGPVSVTMSTTLGEFRLTLDADLTPCTVNSFVSLARQGYFDATTCHRLTTTKESGIAVLQCGDPTGTGSGGPGYVFDDELTGSETYGRRPGDGEQRPEHQRLAVLHRVRRLPARPRLHGLRQRNDEAIKAIAKLAKKGTVPTDGGMTAPAEDVDASVTIQYRHQRFHRARPTKLYQGNATRLNRSDSAQNASPGRGRAHAGCGPHRWASRSSRAAGWPRRCCPGRPSWRRTASGARPATRASPPA